MGSMQLDAFAESLEALVASGAANYGDGASIEELHRLLARFEAFVTEASAAFETQEEWAADGAKTAAAWIATRCRVPRAAARRRVRLGRALRHLPKCAQAWRDGEIGLDQAKAIAAARAHRTEASMQRDEAMLVSQAAQMGFEDFYRALRTGNSWPTPRAPTPTTRNAGRAQRLPGAEHRRDVLRPDDPRSHLGIDRLCGAQPPGTRPLRSRLCRGQGPPGPDRAPRRTGPYLGPAPGRRPRRDGDAQPDAPADGIKPAPLFTVLVGYETLHGRICELENGTVLAPTSLVPWLEAAYFERAIFSLRTRVDVWCDPALQRRDPPGARGARPDVHPPLLLRARRELPGDHIEPYAEGGETTQENGRLLCGFHNRLRLQDEQRGRPPPGKVTVV